MRTFLLLFTLFLALHGIAQPAQTGDVNPNGYNKFYHSNGKLSSEGTMRDGKPDGYWKTYYPNGKLKSEGNRRNFELDSTWRFFTEQGKINIEYTYKNGKKNGPKRNYDAQGQLESEEQFVNDVKQGVSTYYFKSNKVQKTIPFEVGKEQGTGYEYDTTGTIITITEYKGGFVKSTDRINRRDANGLRQGMWKDFYANGKTKIEGRYLDDKKNGYFKEFNEFGNMINIMKYENGVLVKNPPELAKVETRTEYHENGKPKYVGVYRDGVPEGVIREYSPEGKIVGAEVYKDGIKIGEGIYDEKGKEQGKWKEYHETGELKAEGEYVNGVKIGVWTFYHPNGKTDQKGKYDKKGRPIGDWKWYYDDGSLLREETYTDGLRNGMMTEYDVKGNIITKGEYIDGLKEGPWFFELEDYREDGVYKADLRDGVWKHTYTSNKNTRFEGAFLNGVPDGMHVYYYENGKTWQSGKYIYGRKEGDWKYYDEFGLLVLTITFKDDVEIKFDGVKIKFESDKKKETPAGSNP
jgi:antitoxin component YwqK of YwqJK toxin-antitoxin module